MSLSAKVLLVGPPGAGKTVLAKYIFSKDAEELAFIEQTHEEKEFENFKLDLASEGDIPTYPVRIHERMAENFQVCMLALSVFSNSNIVKCWAYSVSLILA